MGLSAIIGQEIVVKRLYALKDFSISKGVPCPHILLAGPKGTGKATLARAFAEELGLSVKELFGPALYQKGDLTSVVTSLEVGELLLLDEIDSVRRQIRELLHPCLIDFRIDLIIGQGPGHRVHPYRLNPFTCVATVGREPNCPPELRDVFPVVLLLQKYAKAELCEIAKIVGTSKGMTLTPEAGTLVAGACNTPREIEGLLNRLSSGAKSQINAQDVGEMLSAFGLKSQSGSSGGAPDLQGMSGSQFESLVTLLLERRGFRAEMTKASGDGGIDIVAVSEQPFISGKYLVQCKRFSAGLPVSVSTVREFYGAIRADQKIVKGIFVTTSAFTDQAAEFAASVGIELIDGQILGTLLSEHGIDSEVQTLRKKSETSLF